MDKTWGKLFSKGFKDDSDEKKKKEKSYAEGLRERMANMSPEKRRVIEEKIRRQRNQTDFEDGGVPCKKKKRLAALAKLAKSGK